MMGEATKIQWATCTFNPWRGCSKVSKGCANCYAAVLAKRNPHTLGDWGPQGTRVVASEAMWKEPLKWDKDQEARQQWHAANSDRDPPRPRVFCASMADVFEDWKLDVRNSNGSPLYVCNECGEWMTLDKQCCGPNSLEPLTLQDVRERLFRLIDATPNLDWLLLTKRPENIMEMIPASWRNQLPDNVWIGTSVEDQETANVRIPHLLKVPAKVRFLSMEPLLGSVSLDQWLPACCERGDREGVSPCPHCIDNGWKYERSGIHWVIVGGESGSKARPFNLNWCREIVLQCATADVPVFVKQFGAVPFDSADVQGEFDSYEQWVQKARSWLGGISGGGMRYKESERAKCVDKLGRLCEIGRDFMRAKDESTYPITWHGIINLTDPKGGDMAEWPEDLRIRELPK